MSKEKELADLKALYRTLAPRIEARLEEFGALWDGAGDNDVFRELVFCLFTPQSKAKSCWAAVGRICDMDLLVNGSSEDIARELKGVRFHHTKAARVVEARRFLPGLKDRIAGFKTPAEAREWLVANINGMSYKEAGHFLRNLGMGRDLAILDRHILKNLALLGVIEEITRHLSPKKYLEIEARMRTFCARVGIPMDHMDMLLWYKEAGEIFK